MSAPTIPPRPVLSKLGADGNYREVDNSTNGPSRYVEELADVELVGKPARRITVADHVDDVISRSRRQSMAGLMLLAGAMDSQREPYRPAPRKTNKKAAKQKAQRRARRTKR